MEKDVVRAEKINACLRLVRMSNRKINIFRSSSSESQAHIDKKREICDKLSRDNKPWITEAIFEKGGRADILSLSEFKCYEIVCSETEESLLKKQNSYPNGLKIEIIRC